MRRRIVAIAALFALATVATVLLNRYFPTTLQGPASALILTALGALLIGLAPSEPPAPGDELALRTPSAPRMAARNTPHEGVPLTPPQPTPPENNLPI